MPRESTAATAPPVLCGAASWRWYARMFRNPLACFAQAQNELGSLCALGNPVPLWPGGRRFILAIGARYNREVLGRTDVFRPGGQVMMGPKGTAHYRIRRGIFAMNGEKHCTHRRAMQPPFQRTAVTSYVEEMARLIDQVIDRWRPGEPMDMCREMRTLSNWVAAHILFGHRDFAASIELGHLIERWLSCDVEARHNFLWLDLPGTAYREMLRTAEQLESAMRETIERSRQADPPGDDVLSILTRAAAVPEIGMSEDDLVAHGVILYAASFETTANALAWTLYLLAQHPAIARDLQAEIRARFGTEPPDSKEIESLPLLDGVIHEALRLFPPVAYTFRTPMQDFELGGLALRPGDKVIISHYMTHRDPAVFPEPHRFDPRRWITARPDPYEYIPFSAGPRLCLGYSFAMLELKLTVARIFQRFRLNVVPGSCIDATIRLTLQPQHGIPMTAHPPDDAFAVARVTGNIHRMVEPA